MAGKVCRNGGEDCVEVREGKARILVPKGNQVFSTTLSKCSTGI